MGIQSRANSGSANPKPSEALGRSLDSLHIPPDRFCIGSKFLAEPDRDGILQMP